MNPKKAVYLRAQVAILRSSGVSVRETGKIFQKSKSWVVVKFTRVLRQPRSGRPSVLDSTAEKVIEKAKNKRGNSTRQTTEEQRSAWICSNSVEV